MLFQTMKRVTSIEVGKLIYLIFLHLWMQNNDFTMQEELEREGIWDFDRLTCPYIRLEHLQVVENPCWL